MESGGSTALRAIHIGCLIVWPQSEDQAQGDQPPIRSGRGAWTREFGRPRCGAPSAAPEQFGKGRAMLTKARADELVYAAAGPAGSAFQLLEDMGSLGAAVAPALGLLGQPGG